MNGAAIALLGALWAQGALVFALIAVMYQRRVPRIMDGRVKIRDIALDKSGWPDDARLASNAYENQFELPVLFFVAGIALVWLGATWFEAVLAWLFVASRAVHALIHATTNRVRRRFLAFVAGVAVIAVLWIDFGVRILFSLGAA